MWERISPKRWNRMWGGRKDRRIKSQVNRKLSFVRSAWITLAFLFVIRRCMTRSPSGWTDWMTLRVNQNKMTNASMHEIRFLVSFLVSHLRSQWPHALDKVSSLVVLDRYTEEVPCSLFLVPCYLISETGGYFSRYLLTDINKQSTVNCSNPIASLFCEEQAANDKERDVTTDGYKIKNDPTIYGYLSL